MLTRAVARFVVVASGFGVLLAIGAPGSISAAPAGDGGALLGILNVDTQTQIDDLFATEDPTILSSDPAAMHFGPYPSTTGDSGTCGFDWATDTVNRFFMIRHVAPMTFSVVQKFKGGTFVTPAQPPLFTPDPLKRSPGACDSSDGTPPGTVADFVTGTFHGYLDMTITSAVYSPSTATCPPPCAFTSVFLTSVFGPLFVRMDNAFFFHYVAVDQGLVFHEWRNASCTRGGNHGDIASAAGTAVELPSCP